MLRSDQITKIRDGLSRMFALLAGDTVTHITKAGVRTQLLSIMWDWDQARAEGLVIDEAGIRNQNERFLLFEKTYLTSKSVTISATDTYEIDSELWQMSDSTPIVTRTVPICGVHNLIQVTIRKAVELNTDATGVITYTP